MSMPRSAWRIAERTKRRWLAAVLRLRPRPAPRNPALPAVAPVVDGLQEPYRTVLSRFRHDSGHYHWQTLVADHPARLASFREVFGDEQRDYAEALRTHFHDGPPADWRARFVSPYASAHPLEDFSETWAYYVYLVELVATVDARGLSLGVVPERDARADSAVPRADKGFRALLRRWLSASLFAHRLDRPAGRKRRTLVAPPPLVRRKLGWIHRLVLETIGAIPSHAPLRLACA